MRRKSRFLSFNLLIVKRFADGTSTTFTYTLSGDHNTETDARGATTYNYDVNDLLTSRTEPDGTTVSYTYDRGNIISVTSPSGTIRYSYDGLGRLDTVTDANGNVTDYSYDKVGNLIETKLGNGVTETRQYDNMNRLALLKDTDATGTVISSYGYTFDQVSNIKTVDELGGRREVYSYDPLYRLTKEEIVDSLTGNRTTDYSFDPVGNRLTKTDSLTGTTNLSLKHQRYLHQHHTLHPSFLPSQANLSKTFLTVVGCHLPSRLVLIFSRLR